MALNNIDSAENLAKNLVENRISTSQLRKFLTAVNTLSNKMQAIDEIDEEMLNEVQYLRVKLAYQVGRNRNLQDFASELTVRIKNISNKKDFCEFAKYMEAIIAYHKYYGGRD